VIEAIKKLLSPEIGVRLSVALTHVTRLEKEIDALALREVEGEPGIAHKREELQRDLAVAEATVKRLQAAQRQAEAREHATAEKERIEGQRKQYRALEAHADARLKAAERLCKTLAAASEAYGNYLQFTERMVHSLPAGTTWPAAWAHHLSAAAPAVANEMWRHAGQPKINSRGNALPGAAVLDQRHRLNPSAIEPFSTTTAASNEYLLGHVRGQIEIAEQVAAETKDAA
jgi:hypothetical protein